VTLLRLSHDVVGALGDVDSGIGRLDPPCSVESRRKPMRSHFAFLVALALTGGISTPAASQVVAEMTEDRIQQAIADEKGETCYSLKKGYACFTTPYSRVVQAARAARKQYQPFSKADVAPEMVAPFIEVIALPQPSFVFGSGRVGRPIDVKAVVVMPKKSKDRSAAVQPTDRFDLDSHYQNLLGAKFDAKGIVARFPMSVLSETNEARVVYDGLGCVDWKQKPQSECGFEFKVKDVR
jgi:hypothetical protein